VIARRLREEKRREDGNCISSRRSLVDRCKPWMGVRVNDRFQDAALVVLEWGETPSGVGPRITRSDCFVSKYPYDSMRREWGTSFRRRGVGRGRVLLQQPK